MAADPVTGFDPDNDQDLQEANARFAAAGDQHVAEQATDAFTKAAPVQKEQPNGLQHWFTNLPNNIGSGLINAAVNTADALHSGLRYIDNKALDAHEALTGENADQIKRTEMSENVDTPEYSEVRNAVQGFNQKYIAPENPTLSDSITQGVAQFAIPFLGWSKAVSVVGGASKLASIGRTVLAEGATAATAQGAHDGRFADMLELGKHTEGKFADALNAIAPDGSLVNHYINYMTDRGDESELEGRVKNIVDTVTGSAVISPVITAGMKMLKGGMAGLKYSIENGVGSLDQLGPANQEGRIGYHGTPHDFDVSKGFDDAANGTGEGNNAYGYGHYLAESPDVAGQYQGSLAARAAPENLVAAQKLVANAGGDKVKAYTQLSAQIANEQSPMARGKMIRMQQMIKNGAVDNGKGSLITADVAQTHVDKMVDWDAKISDQDAMPAPVQQALEEAKQSAIDQFGASVLEKPNATGADLYRVLSNHLGSDKAASMFLDSHGVPGIKFLDGQSRAEGEGTRNLVVFKGKNIAVTAKNGQPVGITAAPRQDMSLDQNARALERERVAAQRQREDGIMPQVEPEPIPANAARSEGAAALRDADSPKADRREPALSLLSDSDIQTHIDKLRAEAERRRGADPHLKIAGSRQ